MSRILVCALIFGAMLGAARSAGAYSAEATDAAFGALLSMPGAQPTQGRWIFPEEYAEELAGEPELIARLQQLKKQGGDFNALRHRGTLLAHAIRAGFDRTALWLLRHGADPKRVLFDHASTAYDLAREYQRATVIKVLENDYGYRAPNPPPAGTSDAAASRPKPATSLSRVEETRALIDSLIPPSRHPNEAAQRAWQRHAATLSQAEFEAVFKDGARLESLIRLVRRTDGGLEDALSRLPLVVVRQHAQWIANLMAESSFVTYDGHSTIRYTPAARAWPALWQRIEAPLRYDSRLDLVEHIPPGFWPGLYASGYAQQDAALTGCLLASVDLAAFKALWPDYQRFFSNARQEAPALVLRQYRFSFEPSACGYASSPEETVAKLAFLQQQGVQEKVGDIRKVLLAEAKNPSLTAAVGQWLPTAPSSLQLIEIAPRCELALNDAWLSALIKTPVLDQRTPAESVQLIEVAGYPRCGLAVSGMSYMEDSPVSNSFEDGPFWQGRPSAADSPDYSEIWLENAGRIQLMEAAFVTDSGLVVGQVVELQSGKTYLLRSNSYPRSWGNIWSLPQPYEWQAGVLQPASDSQRIGRLLGAQCEELEKYEAPKCRGFFAAPDSEAESPQGEAVLAVLRQGRAVSVISLIDALGVERRQAYAAAIAARDREAHRRLVAEGISPHWTVAEIVALGQSDLPLAEKRQRIALLFSLKDQLALALNNARYDLPEALLSWLPRQDWGPVWRVIRQQPDIWLNAAGSLRTKAAEKGREDLLCEIDWAQGFLCGGGIELD